jgi:integrase
VTRRRSNGEGSVYKRADGRWEARVTVRMVGKRQIRKSAYAQTRAEVVAKKRDLEAKIKAGRLVLDERTTLGQWRARWQELIDEAHAAGRRAYKTHVSYSQVSRDYIGHADVGLDAERLMTLDADRVQLWMDDLAKAGVQPATVKYALDVLRIMLRAAKRAKLLPGDDPSRLVSAPRWRKRKAKPFSGEIAGDFLVAIRQDRLYAWFLLDLTTGLRRGECCGVTWRAIEGKTRLLWPLQQVQRQTGKGIVVKPTKTERSENPVPLAQFVLRALEAHKGRMREERLAMGPEWKGADDPGAPDAFVFVSQVGTILDPDNVWRHFKQLLRDTGMPDRTLHAGGRHTTGAILRALGVPMPVIKDFLRHSKEAMTQLYAQGNMTELLAAADKLDELLGERLA